MHFTKAKGILSARNGMNIYRGCTHGCIYCDSRSSCYNFTHDFEDIEVKINAPELLLDALRRKRKKCMISTGAMCDPYMHCESELRLTRQCLEIISQCGFGGTLQTKSDLLLRDLDLFCEINSRTKFVAQMTLTTFDESLCRIIEPNVCTTYRRAETLSLLRDARIPTIVWLSPVLPFLCDTEENLRGILSYCFESGVKGIICFGMGTTMRDGDRQYFYAALDRHFPGLSGRYKARYGMAYECESDNSPALMRIFHDECEKRGVMHDNGQIFAYLGELPTASQEPFSQISLF